MNLKIKQKMLLVECVLILAMLPLFTVACIGEPMAPLKVKNETNLTLSIYVNIDWLDETYFVGDVAPGKEIENENPKILHFGRFPIEAKDAQGKVVYSDTYSVFQLEDAHWKVVITAADLKR
jgi:hypothetical protein